MGLIVTINKQQANLIGVLALMANAKFHCVSWIGALHVSWIGAAASSDIYFYEVIDSV